MYGHYITLYGQEKYMCSTAQTGSIFSFTTKLYLLNKSNTIRFICFIGYRGTTYLTMPSAVSCPTNRWQFKSTNRRGTFWSYIFVHSYHRQIDDPWFKKKIRTIVQKQCARMSVFSFFAFTSIFSTKFDNLILYAIGSSQFQYSF